MAAKHYTARNADGQTMRYTRTKPQGRPQKDPELRRSCRVIGSVTQATREKLDAAIGGPLTESNILNQALSLWFNVHSELFVQKID